MISARSLLQRLSGSRELWIADLGFGFAIAVEI